MNLKIIIGKLVTSKFVENGLSFYKKRIYRAAVSQRLRNTDLQQPAVTAFSFAPYVQDLCCPHEDTNIFIL